MGAEVPVPPKAPRGRSRAGQVPGMWCLRQDVSLCLPTYPRGDTRKSWPCAAGPGVLMRPQERSDKDKVRQAWGLRWLSAPTRISLLSR